MAAWNWLPFKFSVIVLLDTHHTTPRQEVGFLLYSHHSRAVAICVEWIFNVHPKWLPAEIHKAFLSSSVVCKSAWDFFFATALHANHMRRYFAERERKGVGEEIHSHLSHMCRLAKWKRKKNILWEQNSGFLSDSYEAYNFFNKISKKFRFNRHKLDNFFSPN